MGKQSGTRTFRAPGRVNLIGEHTDYNGGLVMPAAINFATRAEITATNERTIFVESRNLREQFSFSLNEPDPKPRKAWSDYVRGVAVMLQRAEIELRGARLSIDSDVPIGAGLSSSAALEVSTAFALLASTNVALTRKEIALLCQRAENEFVGVRSGIMDQFTSCHARKDHALMLNCRTLAFQHLPLPEVVRLVICNTMVKHSLGQSGYNQRRQECEAAARHLGVEYLSELSLEEFENRAEELPERLRRRARHVISENDRVLKAAAALGQGDLQTFGALMAESHRSLRDDYEVSVIELDLMVEIAARQPGVFGARMTGGGFGGSTINLVREDAVKEFIDAVKSAYHRETAIHPDVYVCSAAAGAGEVTAS